MNKIITLILLGISITAFAQTPSKHQIKAEKNQNMGNYEKAIKTYTKILKTDSLNFIVLANRGFCYDAINEPNKAIKDLLKSNQLSPTFAKVNYYIANFYALKREWAKSIPYYHTALNLGINTNYMFYFNIGSSYYFLGDNAHAKTYLMKSYNLDSTYAPTINNLGWVNLDDNPHTSCKYFHRAYELDSLDDKNVNNLGYSHLLCGNMEIAYEYFKKAEKIAPTNSFVYRNYGLYHMYKGDEKIACDFLAKAIELKIVEMYGNHYITELQEYCENE